MSRNSDESLFYHAERISFLVVKGWNDPIAIDVGVPSLGCNIGWMIQDGNHRFAAALYLGLPYISACVDGDIDYGTDILGVDVTEPGLPQYTS
jgi:hypothetical protein